MLRFINLNLMRTVPKTIALGNTERQWEIWRYDAQLVFLRLLHSLCENKYVAAGKCCWYWIKSVLGGSHQLDISNSFLVMTYGTEPPYKPSLKDIGVYWTLLLTHAYSEQRDLLLTICSTLVDAGTNQGGSSVGSVAHKLIVTVTTHLVIPFNWEVYFIYHDVSQRSRRRGESAVELTVVFLLCDWNCSSGEGPRSSTIGRYLKVFLFLIHYLY
ncbi:hypothetical protein A2U01_0016222 [Trifolium medium]|uniref:Uncharacterized protein n=1 Tax=Trifolium medium TaxID=97028 RepID=A0A392N607_9FABA|nr:hypothetical protein [Trifolium medium]